MAFEVNVGMTSAKAKQTKPFQIPFQSAKSMSWLGKIPVLVTRGIAPSKQNRDFARQAWFAAGKGA